MATIKDFRNALTARFNEVVGNHADEAARLNYWFNEHMKTVDAYERNSWPVDDNCIENELHHFNKEIEMYWTDALRPSTVKIGAGCTIHYYTDCEAYEIIGATASCKTITIRRMKATLNESFKPDFSIGGFVAHCNNQDEQSYTYESDPNGIVRTARWSKAKGQFYVNGTCEVWKGSFEYYDYNF